MYSEWASLQSEIQSDTGNTSVLHKFPDVVGKDVASTIIRSLAQTLSVSVNNGEPSNLTGQKEVAWTMEVLCYGLSLPLAETETIKDCVNIYCEWFTALTTPKPCVPQVIIDDPNAYVQDMLTHLHNVFVPRPDIVVAAPHAKSAFTPAGDLVQRQALYCHRVLRTVKAATENCNDLSRDTWQCLLKFLLGISDVLLAPPTVKEGIGELLCDRVLAVLFELWIIACDRHFPTPSLWRTLREMCATWRHHEPLVLHWHRTNVAFTAKILKLMYGPDFPPLVITEEEKSLIPDTMDSHCIAQSWFRFLHILSNPVDLSRSATIGNTAKFLHEALTSTDVLDPHQHPCLQTLPLIFHKAMKAVSILLDALLGISSQTRDERSYDALDNCGFAAVKSQSSLNASSGSTPPSQRKTRAFTVGSQPKASKTTMTSSKSMTSSTSSASISRHVTLESRPPLAAARPKVNSVLHLFGAWLVEAAIVGVKVHGSEKSALSRSRTASFHLDPDPSHISFYPDTLDSAQARAHRYEAGRAEAAGALCRLFCSKKTGEQILPVYLSRFYIAMHYGLQVEKNGSGQVLANIIFNSCDLLRVDLDGVLILLPQIIKALELVLIDLTPAFKYDDYIPPVELRKASIHLLLSCLCLPLHFKSLPINYIFGEDHVKDPGVTFLGMKSHIIELVLRSLTAENDSANTEMLLGGLLLCVQDLALCEQTDARDTGDAPTAPSTGDSSIDTARGLFGHAASLVCNRLMASWKVDLNIALAAMEVLSGLARISLRTPYPLMCKRTVNWICEFIVYQCSRPAPLHSKDLHSMIVAAFHCLTIWLVQHDYLMRDRECLHCVLEVVELGISGSKSQAEMQGEVWPPAPHGKHKDKDSRRQPMNRASDVPKLKGEKERKPVSLRVQEAADSLLAVIMDRVGSFPPPCGPESVCSLLDEDALLRYVKDGGVPEQATPFRYFVLDGTTIVGLLEQSLGNDEDPLPTVTAMIRGPFGRHAWTMQFRHMPRTSKHGSGVTSHEAVRPQPVNNMGVRHNVKHRFFPELVDQIPLVKADKSIPRLEDTMKDKQPELDKLTQLIRQQVVFENKVTQRVREERASAPFPNPQTDCKPPPACHEFQTARMFLSHYGLLTLESLKDTGSNGAPPALIMLDQAQAEFMSELEQLDSMSCRLHDTVHIFYVKPGQKMPFEILSNVTTKASVEPVFMEFLLSLGWPVDVNKHAGWTGHVNTSWKIINTPESEESSYPANTGGSLYDGRQQVLYWADVTSEIAFVVPSPNTYAPPMRRTSVNADNKVSPEVTSKAPKFGLEFASVKSKSMSLDLVSDRRTGRESTVTPTEPATHMARGAKRFGRGINSSAVQDCKVFVVWLESFEDAPNFPSVDFLPSTSTGQSEDRISTSSLGKSHEPQLYVIYIHPLQNGLFRLYLQDTHAQTDRVHMAIPLVDGMVVSRRSLGTLVRQTAINICRRKTLGSDSYQPPHVRRKLKIKEIVDKYRNKLIEPEFYTALFQDVNKS